MPRSHEETTVRSRGMVALGTLLIVALTVLAFAGGRLFGSPPPPDDASSQIAIADASAPVAPPLAAGSAVEPDDDPAPVALAERPPVVCLDPGHGGPDRGFTRGPLGNLAGMEEANVVLQLAWDVQARLQARGFDVIVTRETDAAVNATGADINGDRKTARDDKPGNDRFATLDELQARINICNTAKADLLVSMHINGYTTQKPRGFETWYTDGRPFSDLSRSFANLAYVHLKDQFSRIGYVLPAEEERGVNPDTVADVQMDHAVFKHFVITGPEVPGSVKPSEMPGAIVETLFISNDGDAQTLVSAEGINAIVTAYENSIVEYFQRHPPQR
ncbi:MAG: N-acetylmuramoyl-L-alanine amidase [Thermomicrobiales bacterium]|nr:N-acetylmuramoyl-L-alanine amidase [Thermomicrobiales bacterium]